LKFDDLLRRGSRQILPLITKRYDTVSALRGYPQGRSTTVGSGYNDTVFAQGDIITKGLSLYRVLLRFLYKIPSNYYLV